MSPWLSNHALVAYMLVGAPMTVWVGEMVVRRIERWLWSPRRSSASMRNAWQGARVISTRDRQRRAAMRRHPAGTRLR